MKKRQKNYKEMLIEYNKNTKKLQKNIEILIHSLEKDIIGIVGCLPRDNEWIREYFKNDAVREYLAEIRGLKGAISLIHNQIDMEQFLKELNK